MTLITYLSRVHFADGVLEVALSSELELNKLSKPLLVKEQHAVDVEFSERVEAGLPYRCEFESHEISVEHGRQQAMANLQQHLSETKADVVIAYGSSLALSMADACCRQFNPGRMPFENNSGVSPELFAIPGVDGIPIMSMRRNDATRTTIQEAGIQPTAVIIDPTLIVGESIERTSSAIADALARCLSTYFAEGFNPPAEGIALEGVKRILRNLNTLVEEDSLEMRRELMAASLNGTLAMQQETSIAHQLCNILLRNSPNLRSRGALMRLLILVEAELLERSWTQQRSGEVRAALGVPAGTGLREWLTSIMENLPLPNSLSRLGIRPSDIRSATGELASSGATLPSAERLNEMLAGIQLGHHSPMTESN